MNSKRRCMMAAPKLRK